MLFVIGDEAAEAFEHGLAFVGPILTEDIRVVILSNLLGYLLVDLVEALNHEILEVIVLLDLLLDAIVQTAYLFSGFELLLDDVSLQLGRLPFQLFVYFLQLVHHHLAFGVCLG